MWDKVRIPTWSYYGPGAFMEADTRDWAFANWRLRCEAAILELDHSRMVERIAEAERAIMDRLEDLKRSDGSESEALMNALDALRVLRKIANSDGQPQG